jgi:SMI1-KNR4 cell-wall
MTIDWKREIVNMAIVKQHLHEVDKMRLWDWHLPEVAATVEQIKDLEGYLGYDIDNQFKSFLVCANGWKSMYHDVDIFGTTNYLRECPLYKKFGYLLEVVIESCPGENIVSSELLPIAVSNDDIDIFAINNIYSASPGVVTWFAGYKIDTFPSFEEFFLSMIEYNRKGISSLKERFSEK